MKNSGQQNRIMTMNTVQPAAEICVRTCGRAVERQNGQR
jgi:hypothetical protein